MSSGKPGRIDGPPRYPGDAPGPAPDPAPTPQPVDPPVPGPTPPQPTPAVLQPTWTAVGPVSSKWDEATVYGDVLNRDPQPFTGSDRPTNCHESCHGVNARIRNAAGGKANGFYCMQSRGVVIPEPNFRLTQIPAFIPTAVRGNRFKLYLQDQARDWDGQPSYILDEWSAYIAGAACAIQDYRAGKVESADWIAGPVEFSIYALAFSMACAAHDPDTWGKVPQIRLFVNFQLEQSGAAYLAGRDIAEMNFGQQGALLSAFRTDPACENLRQFAQPVAGAKWMFAAGLPPRSARALTRDDPALSCSCGRK